MIFFFCMLKISLRHLQLMSAKLNILAKKILNVMSISFYNIYIQIKKYYIENNHKYINNQMYTHKSYAHNS